MDLEKARGNRFFFKILLFNFPVLLLRIERLEKKGTMPKVGALFAWLCGLGSGGAGSGGEWDPPSSRNSSDPPPPTISSSIDHTFRNYNYKTDIITLAVTSE